MESHELERQAALPKLPVPSHTSSSEALFSPIESSVKQLCPPHTYNACAFFILVPFHLSYRVWKVISLTWQYVRHRRQLVSVSSRISV